MVAGTTFALYVVLTRIPVGIYSQRPPGASPATHRGAPSQHLACTLPYLFGTMSQRVLKPSLYHAWDTHLARTILHLTKHLPWTWSTLELAGTCPGTYTPRVRRRGCGVGTFTPVPRSR